MIRDEAGVDCTGRQEGILFINLNRATISIVLLGTNIFLILPDCILCATIRPYAYRARIGCVMTIFASRLSPKGARHHWLLAICLMAKSNAAKVGVTKWRNDASPRPRVVITSVCGPIANFAGTHPTVDAALVVPGSGGAHITISGVGRAHYAIRGVEKLADASTSGGDRLRV